MTGDRLHPAPDIVAHYYEELRTFALGQSAGPAPRGFALVLRQGIPAWIEAWAHCAAASASTSWPRSPAEKRSVRLPALHVEVATVLAEMALASLGR